VWGGREQQGVEGKTENMKRVEKGTSVMNVVPGGKESLVRRTFWDLRNMKTGRDQIKLPSMFAQ
jgi:hypothetical protein